MNTSISGESAARTNRNLWSLKQRLAKIRARLAWVIGSGILVITILETNLMHFVIKEFYWDIFIGLNIFNAHSSIKAANK